ncbi:IS1634 family transposase, partial [Nostoc calcicola FACHB-3891]|nr:IS1634 family transposase [Nostoc calcicola FACHB-3891]
MTKAQTELKQLSQQQFACEKDAHLAAERMNCRLPLHQLVEIKVVEISQHQGRGRPRKNAVIEKHYQLCATLEPKQTSIDIEVQRAGRFLLA